MSTATLTSLAMLKVQVDQGGDYLDYLRPFILQVLVDHRPDPVTDTAVRNHLLTQFGLEIPERAIQLVLKRLARKYPLTKERVVYRITGDLPSPRIASRKAEADRHIRAVITGLIEFSKQSGTPLPSTDEAAQAMCSFLGEFDVSCLKAYLRGTALPIAGRKKPADIVLVSQYVMHIQRTDPERFGSLQVLVQGHMLANALLCPDLQNAPKTYAGVTFYLDTPLIVRHLGLEGPQQKEAIDDLIRLVKHLGGTVAAFAHTRNEVHSVIQGAAKHLDDADGRGTIITEARHHGTSRSDLLLLAGQLDDKLAEARIEVRPGPAYIEQFQIDETAFGEALDDEVSYYNPRAREYDINSVRSVYVLRTGTVPLTVERSVAVLVTSNSGFARAAFQYGQRYEESREVSPVITDFSLANMAWLKAPMGASSLPMTEVLAFSYAALEPSKEMLEKFLAEIEKLEKKGKISARDHQLLRSSALAQEELMRLTLGDEHALTEQTITETLSRVTEEIKKEEKEKLTAEEAAHQKTQADLTSERIKKKRVQERLYWQCDRRAKRWSWTIAAGVAVLLLIGIAAGLGLKSSAPVPGWVLLVGSGLLALATVLDIIVGFSVREMREKLERRFLSWFLRRETTATGVEFEDAV